jgi:hypothetical protein
MKAPNVPIDYVQITTRTRLQRKEVDDVLGGDAMWKDVDQTDGGCSHRLRGICTDCEGQWLVPSATTDEHTLCSCRSVQQMSL